MTSKELVICVQVNNLYAKIWPGGAILRDSVTAYSLNPATSLGSVAEC